MSDTTPEDVAVSKLEAAGMLDHDPKVTSDHRNEPGWETVSDDNGELVEWRANATEEGYFVDRRMVTLPEDKQKTLRDGTLQTEAEMLVFESEDGERWCSWITYQLDKTNWVPGEYYRIKCQSERKAREGSVKIFKVQRRTAVQ